MQHKLIEFFDELSAVDELESQIAYELKTLAKLKEVSIMYVTPGTTQNEIKCRIAQIEEDLAFGFDMPDEVRDALHEELDYLESFLTEEA